jgi:hypothetical protein
MTKCALADVCEPLWSCCSPPQMSCTDPNVCPDRRMTFREEKLCRCKIPGKRTRDDKDSPPSSKAACCDRALAHYPLSILPLGICMPPVLESRCPTQRRGSRTPATSGPSLTPIAAFATRLRLAAPVLPGSEHTWHGGTNFTKEGPPEVAHPDATIAIETRQGPGHVTADTAPSAFRGFELQLVCGHARGLCDSRILRLAGRSVTPGLRHHLVASIDAAICPR